MPDFIVIDEVNNKVEQSESNILHKIDITNNYHYTLMSKLSANVSNISNGVDSVNELLGVADKNSSNGKATIVYSSSA